jgi:hypothetical protein
MDHEEEVGVRQARSRGESLIPDSDERTNVISSDALAIAEKCRRRAPRRAKLDEFRQTIPWSLTRSRIFDQRLQVGREFRLINPRAAELRPRRSYIAFYILSARRRRRLFAVLKLNIRRPPR